MIGDEVWWPWKLPIQYIQIKDEELIMPKNEWIDKLLGEARESHELVTDAVETQMRKLLQGKMGENLLTRKELADTADNLIAEMGTPTPEEGEHENN